VVGWYRHSVFPAVRTLRPAMAVVLFAITAAFVGGWVAADRSPVSLSQFESNDEQLLDNLRSWFELGQDSPKWIMFAFTQNTRVLLAATILAVFSFGVMGLVLVMVPFGIMGFVMGQVIPSGLSPLPFILALVPHGIVEVPAILLAGGIALRLGSVITRPPDEMTVGEAWLRTLGDSVKVGVGLVTPLLFVAAVLEVMLTPRVVQWVLML
jgi:uncharacterized membrane protein SpoIIM required for sporulation